MSASQLDRIEMMLNEIVLLLKKAPQTEQENALPLERTITMVKRTVTQNSSSPMWRCTMDDGRVVNIFMHNDPDKNNFNLIEDAGWGAELIEMEVDEQKTFFRYPIRVTVRKDGKWWALAGVAGKEEDARSDIAELESVKETLDKDIFD